MEPSQSSLTGNPKQPQSSTSTPPGAVFLQEGEYWTLIFEGITMRLRDSKGLHYLARLLAQPARAFDSAELKVAVAGRSPSLEAFVERSPADLRTERARTAVTKRIREAVERIEDLHPRLGRHLRLSIRTGRACTYDPDPSQLVSWSL